MSDRLAHAIEEAGIERSKAELVASVIFDAIHDNVATKADLAPLATKVEAVGADVRAVVRAELQGVRTEMQTVRTELKGELALIERRLLTRLGGLIVAAVGVLIATLRHWPIAGP
ncbi:MAG TPA: hypothetical protein VGK33_15695 [Chloroflexota bacterium]|jgi:hypothetical protein